MSEVRAELLRGVAVIDRAGERVGRIEEMLAEVVDGECRVVEYHLGSYGWLQSIGGMGALGGALARLVSRRAHRACAVRWDLMDLSDPARPRLTCLKAELPSL